jgi:hypothetical protein
MGDTTLWDLCQKQCYWQNRIMMYMIEKHSELLSHYYIGDIGSKEPKNPLKSLQITRICYQDSMISQHQVKDTLGGLKSLDTSTMS